MAKVANGFAACLEFREKSKYLAAERQIGTMYVYAKYSAAKFYHNTQQRRKCKEVEEAGKIAKVSGTAKQFLLIGNFKVGVEDTFMQRGKLF